MYTKTKLCQILSGFIETQLLGLINLLYMQKIQNINRVQICVIVYTVRENKIQTFLRIKFTLSG